MGVGARGRKVGREWTRQHRLSVTVADVAFTSMGVSAGRAGGWLFVCALTMRILLFFLCPLCPQPPPPPTDSIRDANPAETADPAADPAVADVYALAAGDANTLPFASRPVPVPAPDRRISSANISTSSGISTSSSGLLQLASFSLNAGASHSYSDGRICTLDDDDATAAAAAAAGTWKDLVSTLFQ